MQPANMRNAVFNEPRVFGGQYSMTTPSGNVSTNQAPPIPPRLNSQMTSNFGMNNRYNGYSMGSYGGYGSYGGGYPGGLGYGGYNSISNVLGCGYGGYGSTTMGGYNQYPENRFIQLAEESSRPAFQNIESLVAAIGNIASMLDSTFFALTNSFRAILGVAANFAHLRGVFANVWSSFALFRLLTWMYRKLTYMLGLSKGNPSMQTFKDAFHHAEQGSDEITKIQKKKGSSMPVLIFLAFIMSAPYLLMKFLGNSIESGTKNPKNWHNPLEGTVSFNFQGTNENELTLKTGQRILIAPKVVQEEHNLLNSGWALASLDGEISGLIPINYIQKKTLNQDAGKQIDEDVMV